MFWFRIISIVLFSATAVSLLTFQGIEVVKAIYTLFKWK